MRPERLVTDRPGENGKRPAEVGAVTVLIGIVVFAVIEIVVWLFAYGPFSGTGAPASPCTEQVPGRGLVEDAERAERILVGHLLAGRLAPADYHAGMATVAVMRSAGSVAGASRHG